MKPVKNTAVTWQSDTPLRAAGGGWGFVGAVLVRPPVSWLAKPVYTLVARNRDKLPGDACETETLTIARTLRAD